MVSKIFSTEEFPILSQYPKGQIEQYSYRHNNEDFLNYDQLSYRKDLLNIKNLSKMKPGQSIFYCSNNEILSFVETSHISLEKNKRKRL